MSFAVMDRRFFLRGAASLSLLAAAPARAALSKSVSFVCALKDRDGFAVAGLSATGDILVCERLPDRAHGAALSPDGETAVIFARRPGYYFGVMDLTGSRPFKLMPVSDDRLFYGHGFFAKDGKLLFATENDFENERGVLGIYDATNGYRRVGEYASGGVGPHEAILLRDGKTAVVANGGIITHPDFPRKKLNLATMDATLVYLDIASGEVLKTQRMPGELYQMSFRHIAEDGAGNVWVGGQYQGPPTDDVPMVFVSDAHGVTALEAPPSVYRNMRHYVGSVATDFARGRVATTCPRGGVWQIWSSTDRKLIAERHVADICGVAAGKDDFVAVDGFGNFRQGDVILSNHRSVAWDNHLLAMRSG